MLTFQEKDHVYRWDGKIVPSVTQILPKQKLFFVHPETLEKARREGNENHSSIERYYREGKIDSDYVKIFSSFMGEFKDFASLGELLYCEHSFYSKRYGFAGTPDLVFENGILDIKRTHSDSKLRALQLAGYFILLRENKIIKKTKKWITLAIVGGKATPKKIYNTEAESVFMSQLQRHRNENNLQNYLNTV